MLGESNEARRMRAAFFGNAADGLECNDIRILGEEACNLLKTIRQIIVTGRDRIYDFLVRFCFPFPPAAKLNSACIF